MKYLFLLFVITLIFLSGCNTVKDGDPCLEDEDCKGLDCSEFENQLPRYYPICEYNKCVCGCGDPENGRYCR